MAKIIEVNGFDYVGKTMYASSFLREGFILAPRINSLPFGVSMPKDKRIKFYESLTADEYAVFFSAVHAKKNDLILSKPGNQVIDRGFKTVISDFGARYLLEGISFESAKERALQISALNNFSEIGSEVVNLDLEGNVDEVLKTIELRKFKREGRLFSEFERDYLPKMIMFYRSIKNGA